MEMTPALMWFVRPDQFGILNKMCLCFQNFPLLASTDCMSLLTRTSMGLIKLIRKATCVPQMFWGFTVMSLWTEYLFMSQTDQKVFPRRLLYQSKLVMSTMTNSWKHGIKLSLLVCTNIFITSICMNRLYVLTLIHRLVTRPSRKGARLIVEQTNVYRHKALIQSCLRLFGAVIIWT